MNTSIAVGVSLLDLVVLIIVVILILRSSKSGGVASLVKQEIGQLGTSQERLERTLRADSAQGREEANSQSKATREEVSALFRNLSNDVKESLGRSHEEQMELLAEINREFSEDFEKVNRSLLDSFELFRGEVSNSMSSNQKSVLSAVSEMSQQHKNLLDSFSKQLEGLTSVNQEMLKDIRETLESRLAKLQEDNGRRLEEMRVTVDEKLQSTLEQRLGESFKLVSDRLEQVHKGLGEMATLASGVGDLKRVLSNVKTRGTMGEVQLETMLEQVLTPSQYQRSVQVKSNSGERVDFAIKLPGKDDGGDVVWLPIDSKFPLEDYQRLVDAQEIGDIEAVNAAGRQLEAAIRGQAKSISEKYINPPSTTDFAIMFVPIEGLFAEVLRRPGLWDQLQRESKVVVTGPTTILAILNSLQMGFRTIAIEKRSSEVWKLLGAVKTEFEKFGGILDRTQKKLEEASNNISAASVRTRAIERKLRDVQEVPTEGVLDSLEELPGLEMADE
ncbi:MAG: DNA recombination protein RmuC [Actinomycetota bacterium]|nr:DNA recombination protein RmuC [Actinomycetota bacterium]